MFRRFLLVMLSVSFVSGACAQQKSAWLVNAQRHRDELIAQNGPGTNAALRAELLAMRDADQKARGVAPGETNGSLRIASNLAEIDGQLTADLKGIVAKNGWPTIGLVGIDASNAAMLVLTHTHDHAWQLSLLPQLESLADAGRIDGVPLAFVIDKELVSEGKLQRYGTQFKYVDGGMAMYGVEDPGGLDADRAKIGLPPMAVYTQQLEAMYHLKASGKVVMATPAK
jgi:hypothetical protein